MISETENEIWRPVPGSNCVEASNLGQIRQFGHVLEQVGTGYLRVIGCRNWGKLTTHVHRLVAMAWLTLPADFGTVKYDVNHIDEQKTNNRADNLNYLTRKDNDNWGTRNERISAKLSVVMKGKRHTDEAKIKISAATKGENNPMFGKSAIKGLIWVNNKIKSYYWPKDEPLPYGLFEGRLPLKKSA